VAREGEFGRREMMRLYLMLVCGAFVALAMSAAAGAAGTTRYVSPTGTDAGNCTASPCRTITYAVAQASSGDTISVASGTYAESVAVTKTLVLVGHDATIDAVGQTLPPNGVVISGAAAAGTSLSGFTVENAGLEGIFVVQTSGVTISGNTVVNNDAYGPFNPLCVDQPDDCGEAIHLQSVTGSTVSGNLVQNNVGGILLTDENGPTSGNVIRDNRVLDNTLDCGITLASHWFQLGAPAAPNVAGVYQNLVLHNTSNGNGAAGIGVFAGPPGAAAWGNSVIGNTAMHNGLPGVAIHSHTPFQNIEDNVVVNNTVAANGADDDLPGDDGPTGISILSAVDPIDHVTVAANRISDEEFGIFAFNAPKISGLPSNKFSSVAIPVTLQ
jgi:parallel beta-helix repeat protein